MWAKGEPPDLGSGHQVDSISTTLNNMKKLIPLEWVEEKAWQHYQSIVDSLFEEM